MSTLYAKICSQVGGTSSVPPNAGLGHFFVASTCVKECVARLIRVWNLLLPPFPGDLFTYFTYPGGGSSKKSKLNQAQAPGFHGLSPTRIMECISSMHA
jgi:hypothetical protein